MRKRKTYSYTMRCPCGTEEKVTSDATLAKIVGAANVAEARGWRGIGGAQGARWECPACAALFDRLEGVPERTCGCKAPLEFAEDKRTDRCERCRQGPEGRRT